MSAPNLEGQIPVSDEVATCPVCGAGDGTEVATRGRFGMAVRNVCCSRCAAVYVTPRPSRTAMAEYYRSAYRIHYGGVGYLLPDGSRAMPGEAGFVEALENWHANQSRITLALAQTPRGARVLEIGCRHAMTLRLMRDAMGIEPYGVEPGEAEAEEARAAGVNCFTGSLEDFAPADLTFDQVQLFHVLEHLHDPLDGLLRLRRLLRPGGIALVEVPNLYQPYGLLEENFFQNVHLVTFSANTLRALFRRAGFQVLRVVDGKSLYVVGQRIEVEADLPLPYASALLDEPEQDSAWVSVRLRSYANQEKLAYILKNHGYRDELLRPLIHSLQWPAFTDHLTDVCAQFVEYFARNGKLREALMVTLAVAQGPFPDELRQQFQQFAERMAGPAHDAAMASQEASAPAAPQVLTAERR